MSDGPSDTLGVEVLRALSEGANFDALLALLRAKRREGLQQGDALESLESLRSSVSPEQEDLVLDLMDSVVGNCHPTQWVWDQPYRPDPQRPPG